jgi:hypothetical protein
VGNFREILFYLFIYISMPILYNGDLPFVGIFNMLRPFLYFVCCVALGLASVSMQYNILFIISIFGVYYVATVNLN